MICVYSKVSMKKGVIFGISLFCLTILLLTQHNSSSNIPTANAQSEGSNNVKSPGTVASIGWAPGYQWDLMNNIKAADGNSASTTIALGAPDTTWLTISRYLYASNFAISIPQNATVTSINAEFSGSAGTPLEVGLIKTSTTDNNGTRTISLGSTGYTQATWTNLDPAIWSPTNIGGEYFWCNFQS